MRYLFRTNYRQDTALWKHSGDLFWYGLLLAVVLVIPMVMGEFYVGELGAVFIFAIAGVGLMLLVGYTGLISLGHAAFLGIGAYMNSVLLSHGVPFVVTLPVSGLFTAACGAAIGRPTLRMSGLYLAIATLAFGSIVGTVCSAVGIGTSDQVLQQLTGSPVMGKIIVLTVIILFLQWKPGGLFSTRNRSLD